MYLPSIGYQKGKVADYGNRVHLYGLMGMPFNVFVVIALSLAGEGEFSPGIYKLTRKRGLFHV